MSEHRAKRLEFKGRTNHFGFMFVPRSTLLLIAFVLVLPLACGKDEGDPAGASGGSSNDDVPNPELVCPEYTANAYPEMAPFVVEKATYASPLNGAFSVSPTGSPRYAIPLELHPGRRLAPQLGLSLIMLMFQSQACRVFIAAGQTWRKMASCAGFSFRPGIIIV